MGKKLIALTILVLLIAPSIDARSLTETIKIFNDDFVNNISSVDFYKPLRNGNFKEITNPMTSESTRISRTSKQDPKQSQPNTDIKLVGKEEKLVVILVNFQDDRSTPITIEEASDLIFNPDSLGSLNNYVKEVSYQKSRISGKVFGWVELPLDLDEKCRSQGFFNVLAETVLASDPEIDFSEYKHIMIVFPNNPGCTSSSATSRVRIYTEEGNFLVSTSELVGPTTLSHGTQIHEFMHQLDLSHAYDLECGENFIGTIGEDCLYRVTSPFAAYTDLFDVLGVTSNKAHLNLPHKETLGWVTNEELYIKSPTEIGIFKIAPLEKNQNTYKKGIKIPVNSQEAYYVEYRAPIGYDSFIETALIVDANGALIHKNYQDPQGIVDTLLIDGTPNYNVDPYTQELDSRKAKLPIRSTFQDPESNVKIIPLSMNDDYMEICIGLDLNQCLQLKEIIG